MSPPDTESSRARQKRKLSPDAEPLVRKRAQNRISQQCHREKNTAYIRSLESTIELLEKAASYDTDGGERREDRYATLVEAHLKLVKENRRLEEALFRLRKKLLSLSNSAATASDDVIFDSILRRGDEDQHQSARKSSQNCAEAHVSRLQPHNRQHRTYQVSCDEPASAISFARDPDDGCDGTHKETVAQNSAFEDDPTAAFFDFDPNTYEPDGQHALPSTSLSEMGLLDMDTVSHLFLPISPNPPILMRQKISITSPTAFGTKLLSACRQCIERASGPSLSTPETLDLFHKKLILAATDLVAHCLGLESYIYGVNGARYIGKVLSWRLGLESKNGVPSPFKPTPLQSRRPNHFWAIDLFNWPDVRDQLVLEQDSVDLDAMIRDVILHSVIEQTNQGVAVGVHDIFQNQILRKDKARQTQTACVKTFLSDSSWVLFEVTPEAQSFDMPMIDPVEAALISELQRRVETISSARCGYDTPSSPIAGISHGNEVALYFGLDNMVEWKLSKEFAAKYSFLDCSTAVSTCDLAPSSTVFHW